MSGSTFGEAFRVTTFGESHGPYIGAVIEGVKPNIPIDVGMIQTELDRRRPGQSHITTSRREKDRVEIISGIFEGKTTGAPICLLIRNEDQKPSDYERLKKLFRPGHAGYTFLKKYGVFDYRGGGRASGRETATRVVAGAIAKQFLQQRGIDVIAYTRQIGDIEIGEVDFSVIEKNKVRAPDLAAAQKMEDKITQIQQEGDSIGGVVEIVVRNCPAGIGEPVFHKLEAELAQALMSIGAVKGFEIGSGFKCATQKGSEHNDEFYFDPQAGEIRTRTNNAGGVLGGISNGEDLVMRIAVKPPSSIGKAQKTIDENGHGIAFQTGGRHDPCICPRVVPVAEAMVALVLLDLILMQERLIQEDSVEQILLKIRTIDAQLLLLLLHRVYLKRELAEDVRTESEWQQRLKECVEELELDPGVAGKIMEFMGSL